MSAVGFNSASKSFASADTHFSCRFLSNFERTFKVARNGHEDQKESESRVELRAKSLSLGNDAWRTAAEWLGRRQSARSEMKIENNAQKGLVQSADS